MANKKITQLTALTNSTVDVADVLPVVDISGNETDKITYQNLMRPKDSVFGVVDSADITKIMAFELSGLTTATTRTLTVPDADLTLVGTATTQTLTNKTLTTPVINIGSDATGDIYYRNGSGIFTRLAIGTSGQILQTSSGGIPEWIANPSAADASTLVKGVVEIATTAEITAGTATGGTGAVLVVPASAVGSVGASKLVQFNSSTQYPAADGSLITNLTNPSIFKSGVTTKNINDSDTTQTIAHGLGKAPKYIRITAYKGGTSSVIASSVGSYNGTNQSCIYSGANNATNRDGNSSSAGVVLISSLTSTGFNTGTLSYDATNISIAWVKSNAPSSETFQIFWEAEA